MQRIPTRQQGHAPSSRVLLSSSHSSTASSGSTTTETVPLPHSVAVMVKGPSTVPPPPGTKPLTSSSTGEPSARTKRTRVLAVSNSPPLPASR